MNDISIKTVENSESYPVLLQLAVEIWHHTYREILTPEQMDYMIKMMYAPEVIAEERKNGIIFELVYDGNCPVGFISYGPCGPETVKLHKLYLSEKYHGRGIGSMMLAHVKDAARQLGASLLLLNVNKNNARAIKAYKRNGFTLLRSEVNPIGSGFVMDDYVFQTELL